MPKPNRLQAALNQKAHGQPLPQEATEQPAAALAARREPTRAGKIMVSGWLPLEARASLRLILAHYPEKLMQDLVIEAFNDLFAKYNVPQTARVTPTAKVG